MEKNATKLVYSVLE